VADFAMFVSPTLIFVLLDVGRDHSVMFDRLILIQPMSPRSTALGIVTPRSILNRYRFGEQQECARAPRRGAIGNAHGLCSGWINAIAECASLSMLVQSSVRVDFESFQLVLPGTAKL
jgi:hypothetical protein